MQRLRVSLTFVLIMLAGLSLASCGDSPPEATVLRQQQGDLLYTFNRVTGTESLFDITEDPDCLHDLSRERFKDAERLRHHLEERLHITDIEELKDTESPLYKSLRGLGYI